MSDVHDVSSIFLMRIVSMERMVDEQVNVSPHGRCRSSRHARQQDLASLDPAQMESTSKAGSLTDMSVKVLL
jgi:hypothetical protein